MEAIKLTPTQIFKRIVMVKNMQSYNDPKFKEYHDTVYDDGTWKIDLEIFAISGVIRFWVSREDAYGNYNNSLFNMYRSHDGVLKYSADYKIKNDITRRLLRVYELMEKYGVSDV